MEPFLVLAPISSESWSISDRTQGWLISIANLPIMQSGLFFE